MAGQGKTTEIGPGFRVAPQKAASSFDQEASAYLQQRIRAFAAVYVLMGAAMFLARLATHVFNEAVELDELPAVYSHFASIALGTGIFFLLRRRQFGIRALPCWDAAMTWIVFGVVLNNYASTYHHGYWVILPILALFIMARAIMVPSTARRTLLLSAPAPLAALAIQLAHGRAFLTDGVLFPATEFIWGYVLWNQILLWVGCALAALASHVNFTLRRKMHDARKLGQYELERKIGEGGMGTVYRATHALLKRPAAVKMLRPEIVGKDSLRRFEQEVRQTCRLTHPNNLSVYDYGQTPEGVFYYAMEFLDGIDLDQVVQREGALPPGRVIHILRQACGALAEAHSMGMVHRDVKPGNLMLCRMGGEVDVVKVVDFGLVKDLASTDSKLTQVGALIGTPQTIAPEILRGEAASPASDLYSLGIVGYTLLTGKGIFNVDSPIEYVTHHLDREPVSLEERKCEVSTGLGEAIMSCLAKNPDERPRDALELRDRLLACPEAQGWSHEDAASWWRHHPVVAEAHSS